MKKEATKTVADFAANADVRFRPIVMRLAAIIHTAPEQLDVAVKWSNLTFAREGDFHHWICAIAVTKKAVSLNFHFGALLDDPTGLLKAGSSRFLRKLEYRALDDVDDAVVRDFVTQALIRLQYFKDNWKAIQAGTPR